MFHSRKGPAVAMTASIPHLLHHFFWCRAILEWSRRSPILGIQSNNIQCSMLPAQNMQYLWQFNKKGGWSSTTQLSTISGSIYVHLVPWWPIPSAWRTSLHCSRCWDTRLAESPSPWEMGPAPTSRCLKIGGIIHPQMVDGIGFTTLSTGCPQFYVAFTWPAWAALAKSIHTSQDGHSIHR